MFSIAGGTDSTEVKKQKKQVTLCQFTELPCRGGEIHRSQLPILAPRNVEDKSRVSVCQLAQPALQWKPSGWHKSQARRSLEGPALVWCPSPSPQWAPLSSWRSARLTEMSASALYTAINSRNDAINTKDVTRSVSCTSAILKLVPAVSPEENPTPGRKGPWHR
ncbi:hypothetical protein NDU88_010324 [Pleurodeles waltl]|uniref:Uncharacterized protein n=1 Tax=Pleurodeles waltl TaxID=8319 RepID=A0AAV7PXQ8_PLEWA|nr:hypothetical protein NDU88_010324 [Pleurodeles waltl]